MTIYLCLDERNGMLFNNRRQTRDAVVLADMSADAQGRLMIEPFSQRLLERNRIPYSLIQEPLPEDLTGIGFFVEKRPLEDLVSKACRLVLYRWNRHYPADTYFDLDLKELGFALAETTEFPGKSHETITKEVYAL